MVDKKKSSEKEKKNSKKDKHDKHAKVEKKESKHAKVEKEHIKIDKKESKHAKVEKKESRHSKLDGNESSKHDKHGKSEVKESKHISPQPGDSQVEPQSQASVLVIGTEEQMLRMLLKFGPTDLTERHHVQQLLAIPCELCNPNELLPAIIGALDNGLQGLATKLRPDIGISVRSLHLKKAVQQLGSDFRRLSDFYCLASVALPYGLQDITASSTKSERRWRRDICNQIDLQVSAFAPCRAGEASPAETAWRALQQTCGISVSPDLWDEGLQMRLRQGLGLDIPIKCAVGNDSWMLALLLPSDATTEMRDGHLCFGVPSAEPVVSLPAGLRVLVQGPPYLPQGWCHVQSFETGQAFFLNAVTQQSEWNPPQHEISEGWCRGVDASTGQLYFFHPASNISTFEPPLL